MEELFCSGASESDPGYLWRLSEEPSPHTFGGSGWKVVDPDPIEIPPTLLLTIRLDLLQVPPELSGIDELPLPSYLNCSIWDSGRQVFALDRRTRTATVIERRMEDVEILPEKYRLPAEFSEVFIRPVRMTPDDVPTAWDSYEQVSERFIYGEDFVHVLGPPLWVQDPLAEQCVCGANMRFVAGVAPQSSLSNPGWVNGRTFMPGEGVTYFFVCPTCDIVAVQFSST